IRVYGCLEHRDQSSDCFGGFGRNPSRCSTHSSGSDTRLGLGPDARRAWEYTGSFPRAETAKRRESANSVCSLLMRPDPPHWLTSDSRWRSEERRVGKERSVMWGPHQREARAWQAGGEAGGRKWYRGSDERRKEPARTAGSERRTET